MQTAYFNRFSLNLPDECVEDCAHQGPCDEGVNAWVGKIDFSEIDPDKIRAELRETGGWDSEKLQDEEENKKRILWIAAWNIREEMRLP